MGILGDVLGIGSTVAGLIGGNHKNGQSKADKAKQSALTNQQLDIADLIKQLAQSENSKGYGYTDPYGGGVVYDPATGTWKVNLSQPQQAIQNASNAEQLSRDTYDQAIRRQGLSDANRLRENAVGNADSALRGYNEMLQGVGLVDPSKVASQLKLDRTRAVNAGYDDAMKAAGTLSLRTGSSAADTFDRLAKNRASSIAQTMGDPDVEALQLADTINQGRKSNALNTYNLFNNTGSNFYDAGFTPSTYDQQGIQNLQQAQALDLDKYNAVNSGLGAAAATIGSAGAGQRQADQSYMNNYNYGNTAQFLSSLSKIANSSGSGSGSGLTQILSQLGIG